MPTTYAIPNGRTVMDATTYTSNGTTQTVSNADLGTVGFKPDLLWFKNRSIVQNNYLVDSNRGVANILVTNATTAENNAPTVVTSFNSNGFSFGVDNTANGNSMVGWQWQAGQGTNTSNTSGSITSTVSVNATAGFSIVTYTGNGVNSTVGHGLGAVPQLVIVKNRSNSGFSWIVYSASIGATNYLLLNSTAASAADSTVWNNTNPTSSVFSIGTGGTLNNNGNTFVAYCWAPVAGFSQFGSYTGNGSADGPFIYTGFRPKFFLVKDSNDAVDSWYILDSSRNTYNVANSLLFPNTSDAESTNVNYLVDFLSNGFKIRGTGAGLNTNAHTMIYAAFAENPFKYANAR
jgi:hypothetical protein